MVASKRSSWLAPRGSKRLFHCSSLSTSSWDIVLELTAPPSFVALFVRQGDQTVHPRRTSHRDVRCQHGDHFSVPAPAARDIRRSHGDRKQRSGHDDRSDGVRRVDAIKHTRSLTVY